MFRSDLIVSFHILSVLVHILTSYYSPNIARMIKSRKLRRTGHIIRMDENRLPNEKIDYRPYGRRHLGRSDLMIKIETGNIT